MVHPRAARGRTGAGSRTRQRLTAEAKRLFAERGFAGTKVRAICEAAGANVAAVSYHFGSKRALYIETLLTSFAERMPLFEPPLWPPAAGPATREALARAIAAWIRRVVECLIGPEGDGIEVRLLLRELLDPTDAMDRLVTEVFAPHHESCRPLIEAALPASASDRVERQLWVDTIMGQCVTYLVWRAPILGMLGVEAYDEALLGRIASHIARVVLRGLGLPEDEADAELEGGAP